MSSNNKKTGLIIQASKLQTFRPRAGPVTLWVITARFRSKLQLNKFVPACATSTATQSYSAVIHLLATILLDVDFVGCNLAFTELLSLS